MLRPSLVQEIAESAQPFGTRVHVLTGMFFARRPTLPPAIRDALSAVDHVSASLDCFHEAEVPRASVFRVLEALLVTGKDVSMQIVGLGADDPYLVGLIDDVRRTFNDAVPMLVSVVRPEGRASDWLGSYAVRETNMNVEPDPCTMAAWPVVAANGRVSACCNQRVVDGDAPPHLQIGDARLDDWAALMHRCRRRSSLRAIRTLGPRFVANRLGQEQCRGYCETCQALDLSGMGAHGQLPPGMLQVLDGYLAEAQARDGAVSFAERFGFGRYASLVALGCEHTHAA